MNKVEAFKNLLRNYVFYKKELQRLKTINNKQSKLKKDDVERYKLLCEFHRPLVEAEKELDGLFTKLTGFHAIRYDKEPSTMSEELSMEVKLELIEKYHQILDKYLEEMDKAEKNLKKEISRISENIEYIESVLDHLPLEISKICYEVYCMGKKYEDISNGNNVYWSASGLYWNVNKELERVLNGLDK